MSIENVTSNYLPECISRILSLRLALEDGWTAGKISVD